MNYCGRCTSKESTTLARVGLEYRPVGIGVQGGSSEPPFWPPKDFIYTALTVHFKCPTVGKWSTSSLTAIENHCCPGYSYVGLRTSAERARM